MTEVESQGPPARGGATKPALIVMLLGLNVYLLAMLFTQTASLPAAFAQAGTRPGDFACVTAKPIGQTYDVYYVFDVTERKLHAFHPIGAQSPQLRHIGPRDLARDFGRSQ
jgi:hypothetical protein